MSADWYIVISMSQTAKKRNPKPTAPAQAHEGITGIAENLQDANRLSVKHSPEPVGSEMNVNLLELIGFLTDFQKVERQIHIPKLGRNENDTEHSYNLAMAAWLIVAKDELPLDTDLVIKYALVHDLVEIYAGDTFALDDKQMQTKAVKEHAALQRLKSNELTADIAGLIEKYESLDDEESRFIYGLDKLMAAFTIVHGKLPIWQEHGITQNAWQDRFQAKIQKSPYLQPYLEELLQLLKDNPALLAG